MEGVFPQGMPSVEKFVIFKTFHMCAETLVFCGEPKIFEPSCWKGNGVFKRTFAYRSPGGDPIPPRCCISNFLLHSATPVAIHLVPWFAGLMIWLTCAQ